MPAYQVQESRFVETVREALRHCPDSGRKLARARYGENSWMLAAERCFVELLAAEASADQIQRIVAHFTRATRDLLAEYGHTRAVSLSEAVARETTANGPQNVHTVDVLLRGSLGDLQALWETTRQQRDASEQLLEAIEQRAMDVLAEARR